MRSLTGKVALVTGGGRGIGAGISRRLAEQGAVVCVNYASDEKAAQEVVDLIRAAGGRAEAFRCPVQIAGEVEDMVSAIEGRFGSVDILVNNAGIPPSRRAVVDIDPDEVVQLFAVHALGPLLLSQLVLPGMRSRGAGTIIMISSVSSVLLNAQSSSYNMAKAAMEALAYTLAKEVRAWGIRVNIVSPGAIETDMLLGMERLGRATIEREALPFGRLGRPDDVADAVAFLASEEAAYVTGAKLTIDGGGFL